MPVAFQIASEAAETRHILPFLIGLLQKHSGDITDAADLDALIEAGTTLESYLQTLSMHGRDVPPDAQARLNTLCVRHCQLAEVAGVHIIPKHHLFIHVTELIAVKGNPRHYSTFLDESINGEIASICAALHRSTFERKALQRFGVLRNGLTCNALSGKRAIQTRIPEFW